MMDNMVFTKTKETAFRIIESEAVILTLEDGFLHTLNGVGTFIWEHLDGGNTVEDIIKNLCEEYEVRPAVAKGDVRRFTQDLLRRKLIAAKKKSV